MDSGGSSFADGIAGLSSRGPRASWYKNGIGRQDIRHLSFGYGTHFCLGASLARLEGQAVFAVMSRRYARLELACDEEELTYRANPILRGFQRLPVRALSLVPELQVRSRARWSRPRPR